eukprot:765853-Lingulodinium_polyedra.AAC.1
MTGSQVNGGWMFFPAEARCGAGTFPFARFPPPRGTSEFERWSMGDCLGAMVDDGARLPESNDYPPKLH